MCAWLAKEEAQAAAEAEQAVAPAPATPGPKGPSPYEQVSRGLSSRCDTGILTKAFNLPGADPVQLAEKLQS